MNFPGWVLTDLGPACILSVLARHGARWRFRQGGSETHGA